MSASRPIPCAVSEVVGIVGLGGRWHHEGHGRSASGCERCGCGEGVTEHDQQYECLPIYLEGVNLVKRPHHAITNTSTSDGSFPDVSPRAPPRPQVCTQALPTAIGRWAISPSPRSFIPLPVAGRTEAVPPGAALECGWRPEVSPP